MSKTPSLTPVIPLIVLAVSVVSACVFAAAVSDVRVLACLTAVVVGAGVAARSLFPVPGESGEVKPGNDAVARSIAESRNEVINAMSILQQEIRLLQASGGDVTEKKAMRDEVAHLTAEVAALKQMVQFRK